MQGMLYYPFRRGLERAYPETVQAWRRTFGKPPLQLQIGQTKALPTPPGSHCVIANGHMDPDGRGMQKYSDLMCASELGGWGVYFVTLSRTLVPNDLAKRESDTLRPLMLVGRSTKSCLPKWRMRPPGRWLTTPGQ